MFGVGLFEMLLIAVAVLILFGPQKLPEIAQQLGRFYVQLRRMTADVRYEFDEAMRKAEHDMLIEERNKLQALITQQENANPALATNESSVKTSGSPTPESVSTASTEPAVHSNEKAPAWDVGLV